jgi:hypothetical protein
MPRNAHPILIFLVAIGLVGFARPLPAEAETSLPGVPGASGKCAPLNGLPAVRSAKTATGHDGLSVHSPPWKAPLAPGLRLRTHAERNGGWSVWNGPEVPSFVPIESGKRWLDLLDQIGTTYVALYRERPADWTTLNNRNLSSEVRLFDCSGQELASVLLDSYMSRPEHLEVQDVRYDGSTLYFNEACQTYSREAGGKCSALVALDPIAKKVLWRTRPLVSNNWFAVTGDYLVAAYGFTAEPAAIHVIRKKDGAVMDTQKLQGTNFELFQQGDSIAVEHWHNIGRTLYKMEGFDGVAPKLVRSSTINPSPADPTGKTPPPRPPPDPSRPVPTERF